MKKLIASLLASAAFVFVMVASAAPVSAAAPGCYSVDGSTSTKIDCSTLKALYPTVTIDTEKGCYRTGAPPIYTRPVAFDCNATIATSVTPSTPPGSTLGGAVGATNPSAPGSALGGAVGEAAGGQGASDDISVEDTSTTNVKDLNACQGETADKLKVCIEKNPLIGTFNGLINFLAIGVGVIVIIMVIIGGIQYITAGSNPQAVSAAKKKILNAVISLVAFLLLYSFMQWLVPGGVF